MDVQLEARRYAKISARMIEPCDYVIFILVAKIGQKHGGGMFHGDKKTMGPPYKQEVVLRKILVCHRNIGVCVLFELVVSMERTDLHDAIFNVKDGRPCNAPE
eukprot:Lithocolla_globosa_v1_NODE_3080_length_1771_cov_7.425408.p2 type:complete len:103 gc:universal NODE_3080_length_1771_cov_7.425408:908-1216(+)